MNGELKKMQDANFNKYRDTIKRRGTNANFTRFVEEVGELARAIRNNDSANMMEEAADCLAWLMTNCSVHYIDLEYAYMQKYGGATCFRCSMSPCNCPERSR